ncbi:glycosyltransferase family 4 protein [Patellaria atrata CBS 101060]|uniref:Glycosyltransferase family 4 protein n=1 Tax=Patellaria atrata CBS 101060 TaxID=1346257 RepID=A0A9P4VQ37_9PEZI|nr:glycosyltransferase family 4 protein [Patellaria atrata CBS 101060]
MSRVEEDMILLGLAIHDRTYCTDLTVQTISRSPRTSHGDQGHDATADYVTFYVRKYAGEHLYKFIGAGIAEKSLQLSPQLSTKLWWELDIVSMVFKKQPVPSQEEEVYTSPDEEADSMARKHFGPNQQPQPQIGYRNEVKVDYADSVSQRTWDATMKFAKSLKKRNTRIAFFNSTPQGGGVALMRHALVRFLRLSVYVPNPKPKVYHITKTNHNDQITTLTAWCERNAERFWMKDWGPLSHHTKGGADIIIVDDTQMPMLVTLAKGVDPERPVVFRSHNQVRSDLPDTPGTPTAEVWDLLWNLVKRADLFVSNPVREFVPCSVDFKTVGYLLTATDWLDGLNKPISDWDSQYYFHILNTEYYKGNIPELEYPGRDYIVQIARFDPSKGIPDVLASYAELRRKYMSSMSIGDIPQLVIAGHGAIDDPDGTRILDETLQLLDTKYKDLKKDVLVMRLGPIDQILNTLMSHAEVALQLSTREEFEVKSSFLVGHGDISTVAKYLNDLLTDSELYTRMSDTVGNALSWFYLVDTLTKGEKEVAGVPYEDRETKLPRDEKLNLQSK